MPQSCATAEGVEAGREILLQSRLRDYERPGNLAERLGETSRIVAECPVLGGTRVSACATRVNDKRTRSYLFYVDKNGARWEIHVPFDRHTQVPRYRSTTKGLKAQKPEGTQKQNSDTRTTSTTSNGRAWFYAVYAKPMSSLARGILRYKKTIITAPNSPLLLSQHPHKSKNNKTQ